MDINLRAIVNRPVDCCHRNCDRPFVVYLRECTDSDFLLSMGALFSEFERGAWVRVRAECCCICVHSYRFLHVVNEVFTFVLVVFSFRDICMISNTASSWAGYERNFSYSFYNVSASIAGLGCLLNCQISSHCFVDGNKILFDGG